MHISFNYCFSYKCRKIILKTHTHTHTHTHIYILHEVSKFKGLRLILVNSQIFNFFYGFLSIVTNATKHDEKCHIVNLLLLFQLKIISYIKFKKMII